MLSVLVVSPAPTVRAGLRALLGTAHDLRVVGEADRLDPSGQVGLAEPPDLVLLDGSVGDDLELLSGWDPAGATIGVVILGSPGPDARQLRALEGRAWAYVSSGADGEQLAAAARAVAAGLIVVEPDVAGALIRRSPTEVAESATVEAAEEELTPRERDVIQLVALGLANKTIAARLGISEHTVKFHVAAILAKLGAGSRTEAVHIGARRGLVAM